MNTFMYTYIHMCIHVYAFFLYVHYISLFACVCYAGGLVRAHLCAHVFVGS